jgi:hypothetical protein
MAEGDVTQLYNSRGRSQRDGVDSRTMGFYVEGEGVDLAKENAGVPKYRTPAVCRRLGSTNQHLRGRVYRQRRIVRDRRCHAAPVPTHEDGAWR